MDALDQVRVERLVEINSEPRNREALEAVYGRVWDTAQLTAEFEVLGFLAPFVVVQRRSDLGAAVALPMLRRLHQDETGSGVLR